MQVWTSNGTWNRPSDVKTIEVSVTGAGGGGSGFAESGGAGGTSQRVIDVTNVTSQSVTVGNPGGGTLTTQDVVVVETLLHSVVIAQHLVGMVLTVGNSTQVVSVVMEVVVTSTSMAVVVTVMEVIILMATTRLVCHIWEVDNHRLTSKEIMHTDTNLTQRGEQVETETVRVTVALEVEKASS